MALPVFNEGTMRYHDSESNKMMKTSVAESIIAASKPALTAKSTALAPISPVSNELATQDPTPMSPMESTMAIFQSMADSLMNIESLLLEQNTLQEDQTALEMRDESILDADVVPEPSNPPGEEEEKGPGKIKRGLGKLGSMFSMGNLLKSGLILALTGIMAFADEFAELLQPVLKFIKEKAWPNAVDVFTDFMEKGRQLFGGLADKLSIIFGDSGGPHGVTLMDRVMAFAGIFTDIGAFILGIGNSLITNVLEMFGVNFEPYDSAGAWLLGKVNEMWTGFKNWFDGVKPEWMPGISDIGEWIVDKVGSAWQGVKDFFSGAVGAFKLGSENGEGGFATLGAWLKDKLVSPFNFLKDLFSFPEKPEEGFFSWEFGGKVMTKFIDLALLPANLAINFFKDIFGFSKDDAEKDPNYEPFSLGEFIVGKVSALWDWLTSKFDFDIPTLKLPELPNISEMIGGVVGGMLPELDSWMWGPLPNKLKVWREMYDKNQAASAMESVVNPSTAALASQTAMLDASGGAVAIYDNSYTNTSSTTSQDTYSATELATDHGDQSGSWFSRVDWTPWN